MLTANLSPAARRELTLRALAGESPTQLAKEYGVSRVRVYQLMNEAREADHEARIAEAEAEAAFWRKIAEGEYEDTVQDTEDYGRSERGQEWEGAAESGAAYGAQGDREDV